MGMLHNCFELTISLTSKTCISRYEIIELLQVRHVKAYSTGVQPLPKERGKIIRIATARQGRPVYDKERKNTFTYRWFIFDWGALLCGGRLYWGV